MSYFGQSNYNEEVVWVETDYVVVGTGSAGSVLANRPQRDQNVEIAVLEAGPRDKDKFIHIPAAWAKLFRSPLDWVSDRASERARRTRNLLAERQDARRLVVDKRDDVGGGFAADYDKWGAWPGRTGTRSCREVFHEDRARPSRHFTPAQPAQLDRGLAEGCPGMRLLGSTA